MSSKRRRDFSNQLVDGLMLLSGSLKAGMSLNQSFEVLVEELPPPISDEFALLVRENHMGVPLEDCMLHLKERMPVDDLDLITTAIGIARETGGDLTEIFSQLVFTIREKAKLQGRVRALTVQGRLQGVIMGMLPIVFGIVIYFINPQNFEILLQERIGRILLVWAVAWEIIGLILIKKLSRVEV
jgi:tight adherence protein B